MQVKYGPASRGTPAEPSQRIVPSDTTIDPSPTSGVRTSKKSQAPCPICGLLLGVRSLGAHLKFRHGEAKRPPKKTTLKECGECGKKVRADDIKVGALGRS